jgi:hypothetical protein
MNGRQFGPGEPGWGDPAPQHRGGTSENECRRAGTPATLEGNIDNAIDKNHDTVNGPRAQGHVIRWPVSQYLVSAAVAAIIAIELGMEGAR